MPQRHHTPDPVRLDGDAPASSNQPPTDSAGADLAPVHITGAAAHCCTPLPFDVTHWAREFDRRLNDWTLGVRALTAWVRDSLRPFVAANTPDPYAQIRATGLTALDLSWAAYSLTWRTPRWIKQVTSQRTEDGRVMVIQDFSASLRVHPYIVEVQWKQMRHLEQAALHAVCRIAYQHGRDLRACTTLLQFLLDSSWITDASSVRPIAHDAFDPGNPLAHPFDERRVYPPLDVHTWDTRAWKAFARALKCRSNTAEECAHTLHALSLPLVRSPLHDPYLEIRAAAFQTDDLERLLRVDATFPGHRVPPLRDHLRRRQSPSFYVRRMSITQSALFGGLLFTSIRLYQLSELASDVLCACVRLARTRAEVVDERVALLRSFIDRGSIAPTT